jgi:hypothetical protein
MSQFMKISQMAPRCSMQTCRHDEANIRFSQFCERAWLSKPATSAARWHGVDYWYKLERCLWKVDDVGICIYQSRHCQLSTVAWVNKVLTTFARKLFYKVSSLLLILSHCVGSLTLDTTAWIFYPLRNVAQFVHMYPLFYYLRYFFNLEFVWLLYIRNVTFEFVWGTSCLLT